MKTFFYAFLALALLVILNKLAPGSSQSQVFNSVTGEWQYVKPNSSH